jgi:energy-coupling factor transporter transmembrane protein EcfT
MENNTCGISFCGLLSIVFIVLKLLNYIQWSWVWVLAPTWIPFVILIAFFIIGYIANTISQNRVKK